MALTTGQTADLVGVAQVGDYATPVGDPAKVQALIDLIQPDATMTDRGHLDMMAPPAKIQLLKELVALKAAVT
jgi:hypothetical protein